MAKSEGTLEVQCPCCQAILKVDAATGAVLLHQEPERPKPIEEEGFPRSILEAMRAGLPVVASDVGGVAEAVVHGETGYVVPSHSVQQMRDSLAHLIKSADKRQRMGELGHLRYRNQFRFECMENNTFQLYATIVGVAQRYE